MRILGITGAPGVGKSTLVKRMIDSFIPKVIPSTVSCGLLKYMEYSEVDVLGIYQEGSLFSGTDRLAMNVKDDALAYLEGANRDRSILFEGDRLCMSPFIDKCRKVGEFRFVALKVDESILAARRLGRSKAAGQAQDPTWLKGRESKVYGLIVNYDAEVRRVDTDEQMNELAIELNDWLYGLTETPVVQSGRLF
jgi:hypothetical protein